jgi:Cu(I)/Ag(I) efflux system periplasmic protein CusF
MKDRKLMNTNRKTLIAALYLTLLVPLGVLADDAHNKPTTPGAVSAADMTDAEIRKIDLEAGKITLKHAEIKSLDMPAMTMVFVVKDKALIDKLKTGDKVKFKAVNQAGKYTVTEIQPAK